MGQHDQVTPTLLCRGGEPESDLRYPFWLAGLSPCVGQAKSLNSPV
jgi:hypothetical protein